MNKHQLVALLLCLIATKNFAQYDNNWYFGRWAALSFNTGAPVPVTDSAMSNVEACSSVSGADGNILFYTNGEMVWSRNGQRMSEQNIAGDHSSSQGAIIIPKPGSLGHYYIFTADDIGGPDGLQYSEVDMAANGGLGGIISFNTPLITPVCEKITACYHSNGTDIWITTHHWGSDAFYSYLVTAQGVNAVPVVSNAGVVVSGSSTSARYAGYMDISPDGRKLAIANNMIGIQLFSFNTSTGTVGDAVSLHSGECYGVAFSPDSSKLYATSQDNLYQYDVTAANVFATRTLVSAIETDGALRLAPDSKIYVISKLLSTTLSVINNPDRAANACGFSLNSTDLGGRQTFAGLPARLTSPFYILDIANAQNCSGSVSFSANSTLAPDTISWDFGDGSISGQLNPVHNYTAVGTYTVKVAARRGIFMRYFTRTVTVTAMQLTTANTPGDLSQCADTPQFSLRQQDAVILGNQPANEFSVTYYATPEDAEAGTNALPDTITATRDTTTLYARVTNIASGCHAITSFAMILWELPVIDMPDNDVVCRGETLTLTAPAGFDAYRWSTGAITRSITVSAAGDYTVTVFDDHNGVLCSNSKTIRVGTSKAPAIRDVMVKDWTDSRNSITVVTEGSGDFEYSLDNTIWQSSPVFENLLPGLYTVLVRDKNGCGVVVKKVAVLMYPKFFTPNADGHHDLWQVKCALYEPDMLIHIFDRYGKVVASFKGGSHGWDGNFNGRSLPSTDYWFVVVREDGTEHRGHFAMLR